MYQKVANRVARDAATDLRILAGEIVGPCDSSWQDVAGTCAVNLRALATALDDARKGRLMDLAEVVAHFMDTIAGEE